MSDNTYYLVLPYCTVHWGYNLYHNIYIYIYFWEELNAVSSQYITHLYVTCHILTS